MTLEEAIEILSDEPETLDWENEPKAIEALKILVGAGKWVKRYRPNNKIDRWSLLPGETEE